MDTQSSSTRITLTQLDTDKSNIMGKPMTLDTTDRWLRSFAADKDADSFVEVQSNMSTATHTHAGALSYLHYAWAKEIGVELRPDMIFNTVISELATKILAKPADYKYLFTDSESKVDIMTVGMLFDMDQLIACLKSVIKSPEFLSTIADTEFESDAPNAKFARRMTFAHMGTPFFNYMCSMCGIPHVEVAGTEADWTKLHELILRLSIYVPKSYPEYHQKNMAESAKIVSNIIFHCFGTQVNGFEALPYESKEAFFSDIFHYGANKKCGSGHDDLVVSGWFKTFYGDSMEHKPSKDIHKYSYHSNYVCMADVTDPSNPKYYCQVVSLAFSNYDANTHTLSPQYGIVRYEITDQVVFNKLAMIKDERVDAHGLKYTPLSKAQLKTIVAKGKTFDPAKLHYGCETKVICDVCRTDDIEKCIGYDERDENTWDLIQRDLCMGCVDKVKSM